MDFTDGPSVITGGFAMKPCSLLLCLGCAIMTRDIAMAQPNSPSIEAHVLPAYERARPNGEIAGSSEATLAAAQNETESFLVVVTARNGSLLNVSAKANPMVDAGGTPASMECTLYRAVYVPVRVSSPRATEPPGWIPDPLVPFVHPVTGEPIQTPVWNGEKVSGAQFGGVPFNVWEDHHENIWIDIAVPKNAKSGEYKGSISITAENAKPVDVPVTLIVWGFSLPEGPTHENHFGGFERVAAYWGLNTDEEAYYAIEDQFIAMAADHRINPPIPRRLMPTPGDDGVIAVDADLEARLTQFMDRFHVTNFEIHRAPYTGNSEEDQVKRKNYYTSWHEFLARKGWVDRSYIYMFDEPNTLEDYDKVRELAAQIEEAEPRLRRLIVEQTYTHDPAWGTLNEAIDIWCPLLGFIDEDSIRAVQAEGDTVWSYTALTQRAHSYHPHYEEVKEDDPPYWQIDFSPLVYRIAPWINRRYNITGFLYWSSVYWGSPDRNPWHDPGFRVRWNGEGFLFYPGKEIGIDGPIASIRLKNFRDGMEDYEYLTILEQRGGREAVDKIIREAVPTWSTWLENPAQTQPLPEKGMILEALRLRIVEEIQKRP
ncbi:MAG: hypothetical protein AMXMBFR84_15170 [Candidatus Hydrogenedentota bacterium]